MATNYEERLHLINSSIDIPKRWQGTPVETYIMSQNLGYHATPSDRPQILIGTCIDFRFQPNLPKRFAYMVRTPAGNMAGHEFAIGYALVKGVRQIVLIGHDDCGMTKTREYAKPIHDSLVSQGWDSDHAAACVNHGAHEFGIADELDALEKECKRLQGLFQKIEVVPLFVRLEEQKVHIPKWYHAALQASV